MKASKATSDRLIFQFRLRFSPSSTPCGLVERFRPKMRRWLTRKGLDFAFGALGGMVLLYGDVGRRGADATLKDRDDLAKWLKRQRLECKVGLGDLEHQSKADITRKVTEVVFDIDNLTAEDWREGEAYHKKLTRAVTARRTSAR